jgi:hypothetical protein
MSDSNGRTERDIRELRKELDDAKRDVITLKQQVKDNIETQEKVEILRKETEVKVKEVLDQAAEMMERQTTDKAKIILEQLEKVKQEQADKQAALERKNKIQMAILAIITSAMAIISNLTLNYITNAK